MITEIGKPEKRKNKHKDLVSPKAKLHIGLPGVGSWPLNSTPTKKANQCVALPKNSDLCSKQKAENNGGHSSQAPAG